MTRNSLIAALLLTSVTLSPTTTLAKERGPTADERASIEKALRAAGFTSWEEIELDDGIWEVDDARRADGTEHEVKIDPRTYKIRAIRPD